MSARLWVRLVSWLVPRDERPDWTEEWLAELAAHDGTLTHAWGALSDAWYLRMEGWTMNAMWRDVRMAVRGLARRPLFTVLAGMTLAVGIGANTAIYSVVDGVLINPLPYPDSDRIVGYNHAAPGIGIPVLPHSEGSYLHYLDQVRTLESFAVLANPSVTMIVDGEPQRIEAAQVSQRFFDVFKTQPFLGRGFISGEDRLGADPVTVIGYALWEQNFGGARDVIGRLMEIDGVQRRIVGVMPEGFFFDSEELWIPFAINDVDPEFGDFGLIGLGRLAEGATVDAARAEMGGLLTSYFDGAAEDLPVDLVEQAGVRADVRPLKDLFVEDIRQALWVLLGTVGFVLLIACANVANLFLVRAEGRQRERAVRTAMGASRLDLLRQHLTESLALAAGGGLLGLVLAWFGVRGLLALAPVSLPQVLLIGIDGSVLGYTAAISIASGILFGLFPMLDYARPDLTGALKEGGRSSTTGRDRHRLRSSLVVAQVALALVLLVGSGLMARSFVQLRGIDLGFDPIGTMTFRVGFPEAEYPDPHQVAQFQRVLQERLAAIPGVSGVGMIDGLPLIDGQSARPMEAEDQPYGPDELAPIVEVRNMTPGYFDAMGIELTSGRDLTWDDAADGVRSAVVSRALASAFWPGQAAVGKRLRNWGEENESWEVVGVAADVRFEDVESEPAELIYLPVLEGSSDRPSTSPATDVVIRAGAAPMAMIGAVREALRDVDPLLPLLNARTVESVVEESLAATSFTVILLGIAAGVALLLGTVGIYGVISYIVSRRTQEIGVRMALGAPAASVQRSILGQGLRLTGLGILLGLLASWGVSRALASLLYGVTATDPITFAATAGLITLVATLATWIPARRASKVDPVEALRSE